MTDKEIKYVEVALGLFSRYGYRKTTMAELAEAAGVSRQTLYASFASKEEVMVAAIHHVCEGIVRDVSAAWESCGSLAEKLEAYFRIGVLDVHDMLARSPDAEDLVIGFGPASQDAMEETVAVKRALIASALEPHAAALADNGSSPAETADFLTTSSSGYLRNARDRDHLVALLATLKRMILISAGATSKVAAA